MNTVLTSIVSVVIVLGVMILVHEWGHFVVARLFGVRVEIFSLGFGPRIWGRKRGDTDYRISALPLGGYVKMAGDNPAEERAGDPAEFLSKPRWQRAIIALAGPAMNIVMAVVLLALFFATLGQPAPAYFARIPDVAGVPKKSTAELAGLRAGDRILDINGVRVSTWEQVVDQLTRLQPAADLSLSVERAGAPVNLQLHPKTPLEMNDTVGYPRESVIVATITAGMPAEAAGLKPGDRIVSLNGEQVVSWAQCVTGIRQSNGEMLVIGLQRGEQPLQIQVRPRRGRSELGGETWLIGFRPQRDEIHKRLGPAEAVRESVGRSWFISQQVVSIVGQLFLGRVSLREMQGVIGIARESGEAVKRGAEDLIGLVVSLSLNLAILNLLPIPILDGGHILMLAVEGTMRRDLSLAVKERIVQVGMVFLLVIFAIVMYNDVLRLLPHR